MTGSADLICDGLKTIIASVSNTVFDPPNDGSDNIALYFIESKPAFNMASFDFDAKTESIAFLIYVTKFPSLGNHTLFDAKLDNH